MGGIGGDIATGEGDSTGGDAVGGVWLMYAVIVATRVRSSRTRVAAKSDGSANRRRRWAWRWRMNSTTRSNSGSSGSAVSRDGRARDGDGGGTMAKPSISSLTSTDAWRRRLADGEIGTPPRRRSTMISNRSCVSTIVESAARRSPERTGSPETMHRHRGSGGSDIRPPFRCRHSRQAAGHQSQGASLPPRLQSGLNPRERDSPYSGPRWSASPIFSLWRQRRRTPSVDLCRSRRTPAWRRSRIRRTPCPSRRPS
jgi:hypothetical protein